MDPSHSRLPRPGFGLVLLVLGVGVLAVFGGETLGLSAVESDLTSLLAVALGMVFVTMLDLRAGLAALIFCIAFSPEFNLAFLPNLRYEDLLMPALVFGWLAQSSRSREAFVPTTLNSPIYAILGLAVLSSLLGVVQEFIEPLKTVFWIGKVFEYYLIFWLFLNTIRTRSEFRGVFLAVLVAGAASSLVGVLDAYQGGTGVPSRVSGPQGEGANIFGGFIMIQCAMFIGMFLAATDLHLKLLYAGGALLSFGAMMLTLSRTSYVALVLGLVAIALFRRRAVLGWVLALAVVFQIAMPESIVQRAGTVLDVFGESKPSSWNARVAGWQSLSRKVLSDPLLGRGVGTIGLSAADNEYMLQLVQCGILGLGAFLWMLWRQVRVCAEAEQLTKGDPTAEGFALGGTLAIVCLAVHGMGATSFTSIRTMEQLMVILGIVGALHYRYPQWQAEERGLRELIGMPQRRVFRPVLRPFPRPGT